MITRVHNAVNVTTWVLPHRQVRGQRPTMDAATTPEGLPCGDEAANPTPQMVSPCKYSSALPSASA